MQRNGSAIDEVTNEALDEVMNGKGN